MHKSVKPIQKQSQLIKMTILVLFFLTTSCSFIKKLLHKSDSKDEKISENLNDQQHSFQNISQSIKPNKELDFLKTKEFRESFYFAASIEKEVLKLITKNRQYEALTYFTILSYAIDQNAGEKKMTPSGIDCSRFNINRKNQLYSISKSCFKAPTEIATFQIENLNSHYKIKIKFELKEWASIVGLGTTLTQSNPNCEMQIKNKKLTHLICQNWSMELKNVNFVAKELRLRKFDFQRERELQLQIEGGLFSDLLERRQIQIKVPISGRIKMHEKEIQVKDDFAEYENNNNNININFNNNNTNSGDENDQIPLVEKNQNQNQNQNQNPESQHVEKIEISGESHGDSQIPGENKIPEENQNTENQSTESQPDSQKQNNPQNRGQRGR